MRIAWTIKPEDYDYIYGSILVQKIDSSIENDIGFQLHDDLKKLYSRAYAKYVRGEIKFEDKDFLVPTGNLANNIDEFLNKLSVNIS